MCRYAVGLRFPEGFCRRGAGNAGNLALAEATGTEALGVTSTNIPSDVESRAALLRGLSPIGECLSTGPQRVKDRLSGSN
jgi:hypothetical protein